MFQSSTLFGSIGSPTPIADAQAGDRGRSPKGRVGRSVGKSLHGSLDGRHGGAFAFSIPVEMGFDAIKSVFNEFSSKTGVDWYYANIYKFPDNQEDDTLLNWWEK